MNDVVVARIGKPLGLKGEVTVRVHTDLPQERFAVGAVLATDPADRGPLTIRGARMQGMIQVLAFDEAHDREGAEALRGTTLLAPADAVEEDDAWYESDLLGLTVVTVDGAIVGQVSGLQDRPAQDLLEVTLVGGGTAYVPFVEQIVPEVDVAGGRVVIDPPPGLLELGED
ncbi:ribosome maturation factor RimM [Leekyejoonella antrihumi]|uniref:Ribosome maturation factor RimM n=1 Tax=Leekyejoonella antrihumi TaxID=1660198 RepID=A0A563DZ81_9MICO|nr:ribosome maturation factor RimM [Leekyejoonella antrihumi]TWP35568.1 ribosome maturation factor RimM [Leekyejoonella antrihumi]